MGKTDQPSQGASRDWKQRLKDFYARVKALQGDPGYLARGMAAGVFVAFTPTIPFHTVFSISLAFLFKGSKPAALLGSWVSNPLTIPVLYYGSYKMGVILLGRPIPLGAHHDDLRVLITHGWDAAFAAIAGGALLGILPALGAYFITLSIFRRIRLRRQSMLEAREESSTAAHDDTNPGAPLQEGPGSRE